MAIKKTAKMSAAPKKVVAKKSDPGKGVVAKAKDNMNKIASTKYKPKTDEKKAAYYQGKRLESAQGMIAGLKMQKEIPSNYSKGMRDASVKTGVDGYKKNQKLFNEASDSTKKYTQKSLENIKNLNRKK